MRHRYTVAVYLLRTIKMALKPTIYKFDIVLSDMNREYYDTLNLTVAQHPSETQERMLCRVMAFCLHAEEGLVLGKGLSTADEADLYRQELHGELIEWIDVGEPSSERIKKASRLAKQVYVYSFNSKSDTWWQLEHSNFSNIEANIRQFNWEEIKALGSLLERNMNLSVTISGQSLYISSGDNNQEINWLSLS